MLRLIVLLLLLLNVGYFAWGQGWLLPYGWGPMQQREPQRLAQQVRPEALVLLSTEEAGAKPAPVTMAVPTNEVACLVTGELDAARVAALRPVLVANLAEGSWTLEDLAQPVHWMIYMGKYATPADLAKKRAELTALKLKLEILNLPPLAPGLSLGTYNSQDEANVALQALAERGVRTAKVLPVPPTPLRYRLRLLGLKPAQLASLAELKQALSALPLQECPQPDSN